MEQGDIWLNLIREYQQGKLSAEIFSEKIRVSQEQNKDAFCCLQKDLADGMAKEMGETIRLLKAYHRNSCRIFLQNEGKIVLTGKQKAVLDLRSRGFTFEEIGKKLGISKAAAFKTNRRCEEKMMRIRDEEGNRVNKIPGVFCARKEVRI